MGRVLNFEGDSSLMGHENRLIKEKSPYLLQHARNPVDWFPWGTEAFEKARREDKLVFLSIGYSTCHWCHVMERESFENEKVARLLNEFFVPIKVDREERPDIDQIYMSAVQAMTGAGGWPLTVFLMPDGKPVMGGTYFPPEDRWGRPGMTSLLPKLSHLWKEKRGDLLKTGTQLSDILNSRPPGSGESVLDPELLRKAYHQFEGSFDDQYGGFGGAPKFPRSHDLSFLLRYEKKHPDSQAREMVEKTLNAMAQGGIYDHLGGGFHRYSTDELWLVPHFEKMLYDQAILARTYLEAFQATGRAYYGDVARDIFRYVLRDMTDPGGGFYSAEDADSEGEEGKFYVWKSAEIREALGAEAGPFMDFYGVTENGNFEHGTTILHLSCEEEDFAREKNLDIKVFREQLAAAREKLFEIRKKRIPPLKDDKILTAWNGLMISALACGAQALNEPDYLVSAERAADFILMHLFKGGRLLRRHRGGESAIPAFQEDYAYFAFGLLDLYETSFNLRWLEEAKRLTDEMIRLFWDSGEGGFFYTGTDQESLIARNKDYYDGAVPSGNSMAALLLLRLGRMTGDSSYETKAEGLLQSNHAGLNRYPVGFPQLLTALDFAMGPTREIVIAGDLQSPEAGPMMKVLYERFDPWKVMIHYPEGPEAAKIAALAPYLRTQQVESGKVIVSVCENHQCQIPVRDSVQLEKMLDQPFYPKAK